MRFEFTVALKYLIPRWRQLSVSIISLVSILVISLVVWLVVLFLSVTEGIEKKWVEELVALNAPLRLSPTEHYYRSYYYQIDSQSFDSNYTTKSIGEKLLAASTDPYDLTIDAELTENFPPPDLREDGSLKDPVKEVWEFVSSLNPTIRPQEYEIGFGNVHLNLLREENDSSDEIQQSFLSQVSYVVSFDDENKRVKKMILPPSSHDYNNLLQSLSRATEPFTVNTFTLEEIPPLLISGQLGVIPSHPSLGNGLLVSKHFKASGVRLGDQGHIAYYSPTVSSVQEQRIPVYVAGFYDPGIIPFGNKLVFVDPKITSLLRGNVTLSDSMLGNGINIWLDNIKDTETIKTQIEHGLEERGLTKYWTVASFHDYEFARPLLQQLKSDKNLFTLIAVIILIVACSNIISMLILLVNDKRKEIGIMQAMGASPKSIASIFGICGFVTGLMSSIIGTIAALLTLHYLQSLVNGLSFLQGHEVFQAAFYGSSLPNEVSVHALLFVTIATLIISLLAGIVPAIKAARIRPTEILRSE